MHVTRNSVDSNPEMNQHYVIQTVNGQREFIPRANDTDKKRNSLIESKEGSNLPKFILAPILPADQPDHN